MFSWLQKVVVALGLIGKISLHRLDRSHDLILGEFESRFRMGNQDPAHPGFPRVFELKVLAIECTKFDSDCTSVSIGKN